MRRDAGPAIEVQPRLAAIVPERWPVKVFPARDELLSSWMHRLALQLRFPVSAPCLGLMGSSP
jgi:hypothetical protein